MIRMLLIGYCLGIRSERRLCEEVHLNLAYRWFWRPGLDGRVPDHSTFSKNRHGRFRNSDLLREVFEVTVQRCIEEGLVGGEGFAVDASLIRAVPTSSTPQTLPRPSTGPISPGPAGRYASTSTPSAKPPGEQRARPSRSSSPAPTRRRSGRAR
jgi:hypothetical protein